MNRRILLGLLVLATALLIPIAYRTYSILTNAAIVTSRVEGLGGSVGVWADPFNGPDELHFAPAFEGHVPRVTDDSLVDLAPYLQKLNIASINLTKTNITDEGVDALVKACCQTLQALELDATDITDVSLGLLESCPRLRHLTVPKSALTDSGIRSLAKMKSLKVLIVHGCSPEDPQITRLMKETDHRIDIRCEE
jgi:hypothetical protein